MLMGLKNDLRVVEVHQQVVKDCMDVIEKEYAATRIYRDGGSTITTTGNLIIAMFNHFATRYGEMEVHTHALVINRTKGSDEAWRHLCLERLLDAQWVGGLYLNQLA